MKTKLISEDDLNYIYLNHKIKAILKIKKY